MRSNREINNDWCHDFVFCFPSSCCCCFSFCMSKCIFHFSSGVLDALECVCVCSLLNTARKPCHQYVIVILVIIDELQNYASFPSLLECMQQRKNNNCDSFFS